MRARTKAVDCLFGGWCSALCRWILHDGLSARATPSRLEAFLARNARGLSLPSDAKGATNPVADSKKYNGTRGGTLPTIAPSATEMMAAETIRWAWTLSEAAGPAWPAHTETFGRELFWIIENGRAIYGHAGIRRIERA